MSFLVCFVCLSFKMLSSSHLSASLRWESRIGIFHLIELPLKFFHSLKPSPYFCPTQVLTQWVWSRWFMTEKAAPGLSVPWDWVLSQWAIRVCGVAFKSDCLKAFPVGSEGMLLFHRSGNQEGLRDHSWPTGCTVLKVSQVEPRFPVTDSLHNITLKTVKIFSLSLLGNGFFHSAQ